MRAHAMARSATVFGVRGRTRRKPRDANGASHPVLRAGAPNAPLPREAASRLSAFGDLNVTHYRPDT